ncbi:uncharacterized protein LOC123313907 isoform X2 [Coccinella septempunctata]|uniref:uncharacterized protein LOC123313907 isoform X2 n=1 Tax=Coccinella septempunctata TaxID=41139 RepID=UPI001D0848BC|nr:uncharacterized protein LOC123313907 isoform X2 [Coccinella septempunctata]
MRFSNIMTSMKNKDRILEAIDQLRHRKARPDATRICNFLFRKYSINSAEARSDLQWCVDNDIVLRVEYKGNISYRNALKKFSQGKREREPQGNSSKSLPFDGNQANRKFAFLLNNAITELIVNNPDYLESGVPADEIITKILSKDNVRYTKKYIIILLEKEVLNGGVIKTDDDKYLMGPSSISSELTEKDDSGNKKHYNAKFSNLIHKKILNKESESRKTHSNEIMQESNKFDPSIRVGVRRKKRGRPAGSLNKSTIERQMARMSDESRPESRTSNNGSQFGVCSVCHLQNKKGPNDKLVSCRECSNKAHYSCLNGDDMMLKMHPDNTWQCPHCKTCSICYETANAGALIVCYVCADAYHAGCHQPRIPDKVKNGSKWLCFNCQLPEELEISKIQSNMSFTCKNSTINNDEVYSDSNSSASNSRSPQSSSVPNSPPEVNDRNSSDHEHSDSKDFDSEDDPNVDPRIPDATHWTPDEVYQYFTKYFPEEAKVFKEQEIDGRSLLLLKRMDVLTKLNLRLGPALKIYKHVITLQVRRDDPRLYYL